MYFMTVPQWYDPDAVREIAEKHYGLKNIDGMRGLFLL